jgi:hypothetical protein
MESNPFSTQKSIRAGDAHLFEQLSQWRGHLSNTCLVPERPTAGSFSNSAKTNVPMQVIRGGRLH